MVKNLPAVQETQVQSLSRENPLEKEMATHSSIPPCSYSKKVAIYKSGRGPLPDTEPVGNLILDLASRTLRNKYMLVKPTSLQYFVKQPKLTNILFFLGMQLVEIISSYFGSMSRLLTQQWRCYQQNAITCTFWMFLVVSCLLTKCLRTLKWAADNSGS